MEYVNVNNSENWKPLDSESVGGHVIYADDISHSNITEDFIDYINSALETGRHLRDSDGEPCQVILCNHAINARRACGVAQRESRFVILHINARADTINFLHHKFGLRLKEYMKYYNIAKADGRRLVIHQHQPLAIMTERSIFLI